MFAVVGFHSVVCDAFIEYIYSVRVVLFFIMHSSEQ